MKTNGRKAILWSFLLCLPFALLEAATELSGKIVDKEGVPLAFANVLLLEPADSALIKGIVASESGTFQLDIESTGNFLLAASMLGYKTRYVFFQVQTEHEQIRLEPILLEEDVTQLSEVKVTARKPLYEQQMDRLVVNVENSIVASGGSALEILEKSPGVVVNRSNNTLMMSGKSGVVLMINGKESRMPVEAAIQMLSSLPADNLEQVELITTPPARFDAEGDAGYINIVLKQSDLQGTNGSFSLIAGYGAREKYGGNIQLNHRTGKLNLYGNYAFLRDFTRQTAQNIRMVDFQGTETETIAFSDRDAKVPSHNARLGLDYQLSDQTVIGAIVSGYANDFNLDAFSNIDVQQDGEPDNSWRVRNTEHNYWKHLMTNLNLQHTWSSNHTLALDFDYLYYFNDNPEGYINENSDAQGNLLLEEQIRINRLTPIHIWVSRANYSAKIGDQMNLEAGLKGTFATFENDVTLERKRQQDWMTDPKFTQQYNLEENIGAAYASMQYQANERLDMILSLRFEYTYSNLGSVEEKDIIDRRYGSLFPTLNLSYQFNESNRFQLAYNRRINRPKFNELAPYVIFLDPNTFISGNVALQPSFTDAVKADYQHKNLLFSLSYSHENEAIANWQPTIDAETNTQVSRPENLDFLNTLTATLSFPVYISKWWEMQNSAFFMWQKSQADFGEESIAFRQKSVRLNTSQSFLLPAGFTFELSAFYNSPLLFGYMKRRAFGEVTIGLQKAFADNSRLRLSWSDLFRTNTMRFETTIPEQDLNTNMDFILETRILRLTYTRSFGNKKVKALRENRSTGSEEERRRVN